MRLDGEISVSIDVVSEVPQGSILESLLFILNASKLFHIVESHMAGYEDDTTSYAVIPRLFSRPQVMESLNQDLVALNSWCLKWHMKLNSKKTNLW